MSGVIAQVSQETGRAPDELQEEAGAILEEMAHRMQLSTVRFFALALCKVFKTLFRSVCVNEEGIQRVRTQTRTRRHWSNAKRRAATLTD